MDFVFGLAFFIYIMAPKNATVFVHTPINSYNTLTTFKENGPWWSNTMMEHKIFTKALFHWKKSLISIETSHTIETLREYLGFPFEWKKKTWITFFTCHVEKKRCLLVKATISDTFSTYHVKKFKRCLLKKAMISK